jgi:putative CRISPR-associated protein (TIGR02620 family)
MTVDIVVTRHPGLIEVLMADGHVSSDTPVISHASVEDIKGKHVCGVLPLSLACHAASVTEVAMSIPQEMRGKELTAEQVREYTQGMHTYTVKKEI